MAMKDSYKTAGEVYFKKLAKDNPNEFRRFRRIAADDSIVVEGTYDKTQDVLDVMKVNYRLLDSEDLRRVDLPLDRPIFVNCAGNLSPSDIICLRSHVDHGGTLVTTDWALRNLIEQAFPGYVEYNGRSTKDDVVAVELTKAGHALLRGSVSLNDRPRWWLEGSSYPIRVLDQAKVQILIRSDQMKNKYGEGAIVVRFPFGKGMIYHMVSHIYLQRTEERSAWQRQVAGEFVKAKGIELSDFAIKDDQTVGEMEAAYLSIGLLAHILRDASNRLKAA